MTKRRARRFEIRLPGDTSSHAQTADRWVEEPTSPEPAPAPPETTAHPRRFRPVPPPDPSTLPYEAHESEQSFPALPRELDTGEPLGRTSFPEGMGPRPEPAGAYTTAPPAYLRPDGEDPYVQHMPAEPEADDSALDAMGESAPAWAPADPPPEDVVIPGADEELALDREAAGLAGDRAAGFPSGKGGGDMKGGDEPEPIMLGSSAPPADEMDSMDPDVAAALSAIEEGAPDALSPLADAPEAEYPVPGEGFDPREGRGEDSVLRSDEMQGADDPMRMTRDRGTSLEGLGARVPGTLNMSRPDVQMRGDGSGATVRSASFGTPDGEVLLPTISPDGRELSDDEAMAAYEAGGGHLGIYDSPDEATRAALAIHDSEEDGVDDEAAEAAAGIMDDEAAEGEPDMVLPETWEQDLGHDSSVAESENAYAQMPTNWETALDDEGAEAAAGVADNEAAEGEAGPGEDFAGFDDMEPALAAMEGTEGSGATLANPVKRPDPGDPSRRLDAGLPTEGDINTARDWDIPRRILHAIGSGLSVGAGGSSTPFRSNAERLEGLRREGLQGRLDTKDEYGRASMAADTARTTSENAAENARARLASNETLARERMASAERIAEGRREPNKVELGRLDVALRGADRADAPTDVSSETSANRRVALQELRDGLLNSDNRRAQAMAAGISDEDIAGMDAATVETMMGRLGPFVGAAAGTPRGGRAGGGSGGGGAGRMEEIAQALLDEGAVSTIEEGRSRARILGTGAHGLADNVIATAMGRDDASAMRAAEGARARSLELVPGVAMDASVARNPAGVSAAQNRLLLYSQGVRAMNTLSRLLRDHGPTASAASPEFRAEAEAALTALTGMATEVQHSGVLNAGERPFIRSAIPDPTDLADVTLGGFVGALRGWREQIINNADAVSSVYSPGPESRRALHHWLSTGDRLEAGTDEGEAGAAPASDTITIRRPGTTTTRSIPRSSWEAQDEDFRARYEVVGGP